MEGLCGAGEPFYLQGGMRDTELLIERSGQRPPHLVDIVCRTGKDDMRGKNRLRGSQGPCTDIMDGAEPWMAEHHRLPGYRLQPASHPLNQQLTGAHHETPGARHTKRHS